MRKRSVTTISLLALLSLVLVVPCIFITAILLSPSFAAKIAEAGVGMTSKWSLEVESLKVDITPLQFVGSSAVLKRADANSDFKKVAESPTFNLSLHLSKMNDKAENWWSLAAEDSHIYLSALQDDSTPAADAADAARASGDSIKEGRIKEGRAPQKNAASDTANVNNTTEDKARATQAPETRTWDRFSKYLRFSKINIANSKISGLDSSDPRTLVIDQLNLSKDTDESLAVTLNASYGKLPITAKGVMALPSSDQQRRIDLNAEVFGNFISLDAKVDDTGIVPGEADFEVKLENLEPLVALVGLDIRALETSAVKGTIKVDKNRVLSIVANGRTLDRDLYLETSLDRQPNGLAIQALNAELGQNSIQAQGNIDTEKSIVDMKMSSRYLDFASLQALADKFSGEKEGDSDLDLTSIISTLQKWDAQLSLELDELNWAGGEVEGLEADLSLVHGKIDAQGNAESLSFSRQGQEPLSIAEPLEFTANGEIQKETSFEKEPSHLVAKIYTKSKDLRLEASMQIPGSRMSDARADLEIYLDNPKYLADYVELSAEKWSQFLPLKLNTEISQFSSPIALQDIVLIVNEDEFKGSLALDLNQTPVFIRGEINAPSFDIKRFATTAAGELEGDAENIDEDSGDLISDTPISWAWLDAIKLDVMLNMESFTFNQTNFRNIKVHARQKNSQLRLDPITADLEEGKVEGAIDIDRLSQTMAEVEGRMVVTSLTPADLGVKNQGLIDGGNTDFLLLFNASGTSAQSLANDLDGELALEVKQAKVRNNLFEVLGSDILLQTFSMLNPFSKKEESTRLECGAIHLVAKDGKITSHEKFILDTDKMRVRGKMSLNLHNEKLRIDFKPTPRKGLGLSVGSVASVVKIGGTLGKPEIVTDADSVVKTAASIAAAVASGGVSWVVQSLFDRKRNDSGTKCRRIFDKAYENSTLVQNP